MKLDQLSSREIEILRSRAARLAADRRDDRERRAVEQIAVVEVGRERYGLPARGLRGIMPAPVITPLRGLPAWMPGLAQVRGEVISVVHLARWFGDEHDADASHLAVLEGEPGRIGALVGRVLGFRAIYADELAEERQVARNERPVASVTNDLISVLDLDRLFDADGIRVRSA